MNAIMYTTNADHQNAALARDLVLCDVGRRSAEDCDDGNCTNYSLKQKRCVFVPQMNKGGKFVFGESEIHSDGQVQFPPQAVDEYRIALEGKVYLFTGSNDGVSASKTGNAAPVYPQQRHRFYHGGERAAACLVPLCCLICYSTRIRVGEKALEAKFGKDYADYKRSTYRLFPYIF